MRVLASWWSDDDGRSASIPAGSLRPPSGVESQERYLQNFRRHTVLYHFDPAIDIGSYLSPHIIDFVLGQKIDHTDPDILPPF